LSLHCVPKNVTLFIFGITLSKINRLQQFFYVRNLEKTCD